MITGIWKVELESGIRDDFIKAYDLFSGAKGFLWCQFYPSVDNDTTLIAVESWESHEIKQDFMKTINPEKMWVLFWMMSSKPEMWWVELWKLIK